MVKVNFTSNLKRFFPTLEEQLIKANSIKELMEQVELQFPGISDYLLTESGALRPYVNIYVGEELLKDRQLLSDTLKKGDEVFIMQAISGG